MYHGCFKELDKKLYDCSKWFWTTNNHLNIIINGWLSERKNAYLILASGIETDLGRKREIGELKYGSKKGYWDDIEKN